MKTITSVLLSICLVILPVGFTGCVSGVKTAAYVGTYYALSDHPEWRDAFEIAYEDLGIIEAAETISMAEVLVVLNRLPVKELRSDDARFIITATMLLIQEIGAPEVNAVTTEKIRPTITQLRAGIRLALDTKFAEYRSDGTLIAFSR